MKFAEKSWYQRSPVIVQSAVVSLYGLGGRIVRNGAQFRHILEELEESEWYSADQLQVMQDEKLRKLIAHCYEYVPFYRSVMQERGLVPDDITTRQDLAKLPILTKDIVRSEGRSLVSDDIGSRRVFVGRTSGTTGSPMEFLRDSCSVSFEQAAIWRHWKLAGLPLWGRRATLRGDPVVPILQTEPPFWRHNVAEKQLVMSSFHLSRGVIPDYVRALRRFQPLALQAYPSSAYYLARTMLELDMRASINYVFTASEPLYPKQREVIEEAFSCEIFDSYGQAERVVFAMECTEHSGLHVTPEYGLIELVEPDGPHPEGMYEIVGTGLVNRAMPLLRYRTGDLTRELDHTCDCGCAMPKLRSIETRAGDMIITPEGRVLTFAGLTHAFMGLHNIAKSQIIQDAIDHILLKVVPDAKYSEANGLEAVSRLSSFLGGHTRIELDLVDDIEREASGKYRWIVSHLNPADWERTDA